MSTSYSALYSFAEPTPGDPAVENAWGTILNTNFTLIDSAIGGTFSLSVAGNSNVTLTANSGAADQARNAAFIFTGALTGDITVFWPVSPRGGVFSVYNNTSGAHTLTCAVTGTPGTTVAVPQGGTLTLVSDGTNIRQTLTGTGLGIATGTSGHVLGYLDGNLTFSGSNAYGTPASITLTNATGLPLETGITGFGTGVEAFLATPTSANLAAALTDETGTGANVFANSPTLVTPALGTPASGVLTNCTGLPNAAVVGLGTAALDNTGTSGATIPLLNGANTWSGIQTMDKIVPAIGTTTTNTTITPTGDSTPQYNTTALHTAATIAVPSGTPTDGQPMILRIIDDGTARGLTWASGYAAIGVTLPTTTVINKYLYVGCKYNAQSSKWDVLAVGQQA